MAHLIYKFKYVFLLYVLIAVVSVSAQATKFFFASVKDKEIVKAGKKLGADFFPQIIEAGNQTQEQRFHERVTNGDIVEWHADGIAWLAGGKDFNEATDYNPIKLGRYFAQLLQGKPHDFQLTIDLHFCFSGVQANGRFGPFRYAGVVSQVLLHSGFNNITVWGYTGRLTGTNLLRQSVQTEISSKGGHCPLDQARVVYLNGLLVPQPTAPQELMTVNYNPVLDSQVRDDKHKATLEKFIAQYRRLFGHGF